MGTEFSGRVASAVDNFIITLIGWTLGFPLAQLIPFIRVDSPNLTLSLISLFATAIIGVVAYYVGTFCLAYATDIVSRTTGLPFRAAYCRGASMSPTLPPGKKVVFGITQDEYEVDDVISFEVDASYGFVQHRVLKKTEDGYVTRGDNNNEPDGVVEHDEVLFKALSVGPFPLFIPFDMDSRIGSLSVLHSFVCWLFFSIELPHERAKQELEEDGYGREKVESPDAP